MNCRACGVKLNIIFLDLVSSPPSNAYLSLVQISAPEIYYPLKVYVCEHCFLVQLEDFAGRENLFTPDYVYFSSTSSSWLKHAKDYVNNITKRLKLDSSSSVLEIACNDGYLLQYFKEKHIPCYGVEPTHDTAAVAKTKGIFIVEEFFDSTLAETLVKSNGKSNLVICNNVLAHVPDLTGFIGGLKRILKAQGTITIEVPYIKRLMEDSQFDTIYHEHFSYFSLTSLIPVFNNFGLTIYDVDELTTHGGSIRIYCQHSEEHIQQSQMLKKLVLSEFTAGINTLAFYSGFQNKVNLVKNTFLSFLLTARSQNKTVVAYGAAAKGNTLINYCGIKSDLIPYVVDKAPSKIGKFLPGSHIPVMPEDIIKELQPDYILILPWNIKEEVMDQLAYIRTWKAKFVVAIPKLHIY